MAKSVSKNNGNGILGFILVFLGSLTYLYAAYSLLNGLQLGWTPNLIIFGSVGSFFLPIFIGLGVVCSIGLFFSSFGLIKNEKRSKIGVGKTSIIGGVSLIALFAGSTTAPALVWYVILGFALSLIGSIVSDM